MSTNGNGFFGNLSGGRFLANLYAKDSIQAVFFQKIINSINVVAQNAGVGPIADVPPPSPVNQVNVKTSGEYLNVTLNHAASVSRGINYFVEVAQNDPDFKQPIVHSLGPSRSTPPIQLPTFDDNGNTNKYYVRAFAQYPGSKPSKVTTFGGAFQPASITMGGTTKLTLLPSTGSGTSSTTGQQGASGFGRVLTANKLTGSGAQGGGPSASVPPSGGGGTGPVVTPPSTGSGLNPNLAIGDTFLNWPVTDPATFELTEDFASGFGPGNSGSTFGQIGQLGWYLLSPGFDTFLRGYQFPNSGVIEFTTSNTASNGAILTLANPISNSGSVFPGFPLFASTGWKCTFIFKWPLYVGLSSGSSSQGTLNPFTKVSFYLGLANLFPTSIARQRPGKFIGLRFDTDTTSPSIADSTYHYEIVQNTAAGNNTQGAVADTGIAPDNNWHRLDMLSSSLGSVTFSLDGGASATLTGTADSSQPTSGSCVNSEQIIGMASARSCACPGTVTTVSGVNVIGSPEWGALNGSWVVADVQSGLSSASSIPMITGNGTIDFGSGTSLTNGAVTWFNMFCPCIMFGNDSTASPQNKLMFVDYFDFIQNPKLATDFNGTSDPTQARFYPTQL